MSYQTSRKQLLGFEIGCFVQKSFIDNLSIENQALRKLHIIMQRLMAGDVRQLVAGNVAIDNQMNILLIHRKNDQRGNSLYDGINVYSK
jgi:hypothetical protein